MAFSDWATTTSNQSGFGIGSWANTAADAAALGLTGAGTNCRRLTATASGAQYGNYALSLTSAAASGAFNAVPNTKKISLRAFLRNDSGLSNVSLMVKGAVGNGESERYGGYRLALGSLVAINSGSSFALRIMSVRASDGTRVNTVCSGSYTTGTFYRLRLDVTPQGGVSDLLEAYTGTGTVGSETWTLVGSQTVLSSDATFNGWGTATQHGIYMSASNDSGSTTFTSFVDAFHAEVSGV